MPTDQDPIPREALPPGWGPAEHCDGHFAYRHDRPPIELIATRTAADRTHPSLGLGRCWELQYRHPVGDISVAETIGRVSTRQAALDGLLECMRCIHDSVRDSNDPIEIQSLLESVSFGDIVPDNVADSSW